MMLLKRPRKYISDERARAMVCRIIDSFEGDVGLGLGSQICQIMELLVLNDLDHFIKEQLHIKYYVRYMDDFILIHPSKEYLQECKQQILTYLTNLGFELNKKTSLHEIKQGIIFLQWHYYIKETGRIIMTMKTQKVSKIKKRLQKIWLKEQHNQVMEGTTWQSCQSFLANAFRGNTNAIRKELEKFYYQLTGDVFMYHQHSQK